MFYFRRITLTTLWKCLSSVPVKNPGPHHAAAAVDRDVNTQCLVHPHYVTKPKVQRNERSDEGARAEYDKPTIRMKRWLANWKERTNT